MDLMGLFLELMENMILLLMKPFSLFKLVCLFSVRTISLITHTWIQLVKVIIHFHVGICWKVIIWTLALLSLPIRLLSAIQRERLLESHLHEMQIQLENLLWDKKELDEQFQLAIEDCRIVESILAELEEEHEKSIAKIELLENELQDLKDHQNLRFDEIQGKDFWNLKAQDVPVSCQDVPNVKDYGIPLETEYGNPSWNPYYNESSVILKDQAMYGDAWEDESKGKIQSPDFLKIGAKASGLVYPFSTKIIHRNLTVNVALDRCKGVALSQSLFSAILSLLVGMIIWEAEDPCMPLVVALFSVVGMSLRSVVLFFSTIKNKPASDAVALLSFNWFILGTLTYPTLPRVAHMFAPLALSLVSRVVRWLGVSSS